MEKGRFSYLEKQVCQVRFVRSDIQLVFLITVILLDDYHFEISFQLFPFVLRVSFHQVHFGELLEQFVGHITVFYFVYFSQNVRLDMQTVQSLVLVKYGINLMLRLYVALLPHHDLREPVSQLLSFALYLL